MTTDSFSKLLTFLLLIFSILNLGVESQNAPCTTPSKHQGLCVPINRCQNIYRIVTSAKPVPTRVATYITQAACTLPNVVRSVCCQPAHVVEEEPSAPTITQPRFDFDLLLPADCGQSVNDRIANGNLTVVFQYPWMAVLQYDKNGVLEDGCGGSLINKRYVLTAAHCIKTRSTIRLVSVRLGEHNKSQVEDCNIYRDANGEEFERDCAGPPVDYEIESSVFHPDYNRPRSRNDIGLIRLKKDVIMQDHIKPICLPVTPELRTLQLDRFIVTGWGATENGPGSQVLLQAIVPKVDNSDCQRTINRRRLNVELSDKQICAGGQDKVDACRGDSGGPLGFNAKYNGQARFVQFGVVASGVDSCGMTSIPGIYTRVSSYMDWIQDNMRP